MLVCYLAYFSCSLKLESKSKDILEHKKLTSKVDSNFLFKMLLQQKYFPNDAESVSFRT